MKFFVSLIILCLLFLVPTEALAVGATLSLSPSSGTFNRGCNFALDIEVDTGDNVTDGVDIILLFDKAKLNAVTITEDPNGNTYEDFPGKSIDNANGKITISGLAPIGSGFSGDGTVARVEFTVLGTGVAQVNFDFNPNDPSKTTDSNVVQTGTIVDVLESVTNGSYSLGTGACSAQSPDADDDSSPTPASSVSRGSTGLGSSKGGVATGSATLPEAGFSKPTVILAIIGGFLTIVGILGLALL